MVCHPPAVVELPMMPIDCTALVWGLGSIHCVTQQQPKVGKFEAVLGPKDTYSPDKRFTEKGTKRYVDGDVPGAILALLSMGVQATNVPRVEDVA